MFAGKHALCSLTVGGSAQVHSEVGVYGPIESLLHPIHQGIFRFCGFAVLEPFVVYGPSRMSAGERAECLARWRERVLGLDRAPVTPGPAMADYEGLVLRSARTQSE